MVREIYLRDVFDKLVVFWVIPTSLWVFDKKDTYFHDVRVLVSSRTELLL